MLQQYQAVFRSVTTFLFPHLILQLQAIKHRKSHINFHCIQNGNRKTKNNKKENDKKENNKKEIERKPCKENPKKR